MDKPVLTVVSILIGIGILILVALYAYGFLPANSNPAKLVEIDKAMILLYDTNNDGVYDENDVAKLRLRATGLGMGGVAQIQLNSPAVLIFEDGNNANDADLLGDSYTASIDPDFSTDSSVSTIDIVLDPEAIVNSTGAPANLGLRDLGGLPIEVTIVYSDGTTATKTLEAVVVKY